MNKLLTGSDNEAERAIIEAVYMGAAVAIPWFASYVINNPAYFTPEWVLVCRIALSILANRVAAATV